MRTEPWRLTKAQLILPVVQNSPRSGSPTSSTSAQNPTPPTVDWLQTNNEVSQSQVESTSGQDTRLQSVSLLSVRGDEQQSQAAPQGTSNTQQAASASPTQGVIGGERSADAGGASSRQPVIVGKAVSNDDQNGENQWHGMGECLLKFTPTYLMDYANSTKPS